MASFSLETRSSHPSSAQVDALISFLETRLDLAKGFGKTQMQREKAKKDWFRITLKLNNMTGGTVKTVKRWMKYWSDKKSAVKKKHAALENCQQDGAEIPELSDTDERILALMRACENVSTSQPNTRLKKEPTEQNTVESSQNSIEKSFLLDEEMGEYTSTEDNNESDDVFLSSCRFNNTTHSKEENNISTVSSSRSSRINKPSKDDLPSINQANFMLVADKLCRIEQQRLELDRRMLDVMERNSDRDHLLAEAVKAMGEGLKALAQAISKS